MKQEEFELVSAGEVKEDADNVYFAWRQLEVSNRLQDQTCQFLLFCSASAFTPEFLTEFIVNYHRHGAHLLKIILQKVTTCCLKPNVWFMPVFSFRN